MEGRFNVAFEDVKYVAYPALRHRIITNFDAPSEGISADALIGELIKLQDQSIA
jgi:MoxR-like ATPase